MHTHNIDQRVLELLSQTYPNASAVATEIINLQAILRLPKGTEHFVADLHGEHEAFTHLLKNASGRIKRKVEELYADKLSEQQLRELCTLIYYPAEKLEQLRAQEQDTQDYYRTNLMRLIRVLQVITSKYTRSHVRKFLPQQFAYIIEEMLHESPHDDNKQAYYHGIIQSIIATHQAAQFITAIAIVIQRLAIDQLHILGDIYDRGPGAHIIMERLMQLKDFDIQWGNHDALWMGAAAGNTACIANVVRLCLRHNNLATLEDGYAVNLLPLATHAIDTYADDPLCLRPTKEATLNAQMHKAISVIQYKLEGQLIANHPEWNMHHRRLLLGLSADKTSVTIDGRTYPLTDTFLPTVDSDEPEALTTAEHEVVERMRHTFKVSERLQRHMRLLLHHGCMYAITNGNLLFHASIPLNADGTLKEVSLQGRKLKGKELLHQTGMLMRQAFNATASKQTRHDARDHFWYLWCGPDSPLFDKDKMTTFERQFIDDPETHHEQKGHYFTLRNDPQVIDHILDQFEVGGNHRHIINGHVPIHASRGESPIKADGRLMVIDGGFSHTYHQTTGIAGYTLVHHSRGFELIEHEPFTTAKEAAERGTDIAGSITVVEHAERRLTVDDTDKGQLIQRRLTELQALLHANRNGQLRER